MEGAAYWKEMPYCATLSKPDFQTRVTSQAFVACSRHDKKAETAFPPTGRLSAGDGGPGSRGATHLTECAVWGRPGPCRAVVRGVVWLSKMCEERSGRRGMKPRSWQRAALGGAQQRGIMD